MVVLLIKSASMKGARVHCRVSVFRISAVLGWEESPPKITYRPKIIKSNSHLKF
jgi:hypothetical protein